MNTMPTTRRELRPDEQPQDPSEEAPDASRATQQFHSILFPGPALDHRDAHDAPAFFHDLNLDQVVTGITTGWEEYDLSSFYYDGPQNLHTILYRQEVMQDLEHDRVRESVEDCSRRMHTMRVRLRMVKELEYRYEKERCVLGAIESYCNAVRGIVDALRSLDMKSRGMRALRRYLEQYTGGAFFRELTAATQSLLDQLASIRYGLLIRDNTITVLPYGGESDYAAVVQQLFAKFSLGTRVTPGSTVPDASRLNHIEAQVLDGVASLHPGIFAALDAFCTRYATFSDDTIVTFDREVQFYLAYFAYIGKLRRAGLSFCYPQVSATSKTVCCRDAFDVALASALRLKHGTVVCNDVSLGGTERVLVVSGPNHGGKTTFARMFGQLHYLANLGCPVPGTSARVFHFDRMFVHFERAENVGTRRGKLQDELVRLHRILAEATPNSIIILNEIFGSTTLKDARYLSTQIMAAVTRLDALAVCVTFLDDLASFNEKTVSMVGMIDPRDPTVRTFKVDRRPADGLAYALAIAEKYRVTRDWLTERIAK
jgi:hypothetical protein